MSIFHILKNNKDLPATATSATSSTLELKIAKSSECSSSNHPGIFLKDKREGTADQDKKVTIGVCADCLAGRAKGIFQAGGVEWCRLNPIKGGPADFKPAPENCPAGNPTFKERQR